MDLFVMITLMLFTMSPVKCYSDTQVQEPPGHAGQGTSLFLMQHVFKLEGKVETKLKHMEEDIEELKSKAIDQEGNALRIGNLSQDLESSKRELQDSTSALKQETAVLQERISELQRTVSRIWSSGTTSLCPKGWTPFGESCYKIKYHKMKWGSALLNCREEGGYLAEIESEAEGQFLRKEAMLIQENLWVGGSDILREGDWQWVTSEKKISGGSFTDWYPGEPSNGKGKEHCLHIYTSLQYRWNDAPCANQMGYICEM